jgi:hypothetical protein
MDRLQVQATERRSPAAQAAKHVLDIRFDQQHVPGAKRIIAPGNVLIVESAPNGEDQLDVLDGPRPPGLARRHVEIVRHTNGRLNSIRRNQTHKTSTMEDLDYYCTCVFDSYPFK